MIKSGVSLIVFLFITCNLWAQSEIFISDENKNISKINIANNNCTSTVVVNTASNLSDITLHPNGNMYACSFTARKIYRVNMTTGALTELTTITEANRLVGMTADANGLIYITEGNVIPSRLFVYDPVANTYESRGFLADGSAGDLTWYFGNLYNASDNNKLVKVDVNNAANSTVVGSFSGVVKPGDRIFALVTVIANCDNSVTYGLSEKGDYYRLDMATAIVDRLCIGNVDLYGSTSADEFNASECFLTLDLDKNNSSGATGSNYQVDFSCLPDAKAPIADIDVEVEVANLVDSILIEITSGALDGSNEFLSVGTATNINTNNLDQKIVGISNGSATTANFEAFLSSMRYNNTAFPVSEGLRTVRVIGYSEGRSDTGFATITIVDDVEAGNDGTISFCTSDAPANLFNSLGGSPDVGGIWRPSLTSNSGIFNPAVDPAGVYYYVVSDGCFIDSAKVTVSVASSSTFDLGNDTTICFGSSFILNADVGNPSATYTWSNGASDSAIVVTASGNYSVLIDIGTCQVSDNITVTFVDFQLELGNDVTVCPGDSVIIGDDIGQAGATYLWNTGETTAEIYASTFGNYSVEVSLQSCKKTDNINVNAATGSPIPVDLGPDTTICPGNNLVLSSGYSTAVYDHLWSTGSTSSSITVTTPGTYSVTLNNGCETGTDTIIVSLKPNTIIPLNLGADITICDGQTTSITTSYSAPEYTHQWSTGSTSETIVVSDPGTYTLTITGNCETGTDAIEVFTIDCDTIPVDTTINDTIIIPIDTTEFYYCEILMPSAFTPNGDNKNDQFGPVNICEGFLSYELYVYNRYGETVFRGSDATWDGTFKGKEAPMDNYIWYAIYFYEADKIVTERGNIVLLR